ncbi:hypothetical protein IWZ01DRAFT_574720 [Phyllosticta capitalensis]
MRETHWLGTRKRESVRVAFGDNFTLSSFTSEAPYLLGQQIPPPSTRMQANSQVKRQLASLFEAPNKRQKRNHLIEAVDKTLDEHDDALAEVRRAHGAAIRERNGALYKLNIANQELEKVESERDEAIKERDSLSNELDKAINERNSAIHERDSAIAERKSAVLRYTNSLRSFKAQNTKLRTAASKHDNVLKSTIDEHNLAIQQRDAAIRERDVTAQKYKKSLKNIIQERDSVRLQNHGLRCTVDDYTEKLNSRICLHHNAVQERNLAQQARDTAHQDRNAAIQDREATSKRNGELLDALSERSSELRAVKRERDALLAAYKGLDDSSQQFHATFNQILKRAG